MVDDFSDGPITEGKSDSSNTTESMDVMQPSIEALQRFGTESTGTGDAFIGKSSSERLEIGGEQAALVARLLRRIMRA